MKTAMAALAMLLITCTTVQAEPRKAYDKDAPQWLRAVGKLNVPGRQYHEGYSRHQQENCSGTLVARANRGRANTVITAWHCLEFYRDLSQPILFTLKADDGEAAVHEAYRVADGGGMHADWAVLKLYRAVSTQDVPALMPHPGRADPDRTVTMAGYSGDTGIGKGGNVLTYHSNCRITQQLFRESESDCEAYKGASGGAVMQLALDGSAQLGGVISRGNSQGVTLYVPVSGFRSALERHLD